MAVAMLLTVASFAQKKSVVGKWQIASIKTKNGLDMNLEDRADLKKMMSAQMAKEGKQPDSAQLEMVVNMLTSAFQGMYMEFTEDGTANFVAPGQQGGKPKTEVAKYTADYINGIIHTVSKESGKENKEKMSFKFEGDYLIIQKESKEDGGDTETLKLKKATN